MVYGAGFKRQPLRRVRTEVGTGTLPGFPFSLPFGVLTLSPLALCPSAYCPWPSRWLKHVGLSPLGPLRAMPWPFATLLACCSPSLLPSAHVSYLHSIARNEPHMLQAGDSILAMCILRSRS